MMEAMDGSTNPPTKVAVGSVDLAVEVIVGAILFVSSLGIITEERMVEETFAESLTMGMAEVAEKAKPSKSIEIIKVVGLRQARVLSTYSSVLGHTTIEVSNIALRTVLLPALANSRDENPSSMGKPTNSMMEAMDGSTNPPTKVAVGSVDLAVEVIVGAILFVSSLGIITEERMVEETFAESLTMGMAEVAEKAKPSKSIEIIKVVGLIMRVRPDSGSSAPEEGQRSQIEYLFSEAILSLSASDIFDFFLEDESVEVVETFGTTSIILKLEASAIEDYELASKAFSKFIYLVDVNKLLCEPRKIIRQKILDYFIWLIHYMNGYMECSAELLTEVRKHKIDIEMLKITKDKVMKIAGEASMRVDTVERKAKDAKMALRGAKEENSWLLGNQEALVAKIKKLKTQFTKARKLKAEVAKIKTMLKVAEEKIAEL
ncbi:hypothetical protein COCNU_scaffold029945G000020 [Cocos nucifera]|nr:hypothetical protein [Cocos nucifera]